MGYPAPAVSSHLGLRMAPFRFIPTPSQSFLLAQQSVLLSASNCAAHFILAELSQCSSVHWHRYQMEGDFRKWTGSSDAMGKDFQQNHNQIWSDVKVLAGAGTGTQKLHSSCHAPLIRSGRREGVHSLTARPCLWDLAQSAWRITQNWPASLWYSLYVTSVHFETHVHFGESFHALSLLQPQETLCLPEPKRWDGWASLSLHFERSTAHFLCTGVNVFLAFNQWCTSYRGTVD